ncbi:MarR family winged helix-turn-helix transcriptional regulator [Sneathiella chinensis]|uniref:MarR family transcriptional regulator n=1 Tax=Sneathiella chinensis TaxID=349750 RepID=A0ABQ5U7A4_9PROT|nr:MarR family transcriptional regulator [Sneathiella chinensis]GLQ08025.1 MarR family transcriptional regulator [Sneathiella chinensis]
MIDDLSNRLFFRLYQTANLLNKVGTRALDAEQVTTQQWSILGALSRDSAKDGMTVSQLCAYLQVSRQNMAGLLGRLEERGVITRSVDPDDLRSRRIRLTEKGAALWQTITPLIEAFYDTALSRLSYDDRVSLVHFLNILLKTMQEMDRPPAGQPNTP